MESLPEIARCPEHGVYLQRDKCPACNNAYMRLYLRKRHQTDPVADMLKRARDRATRRSLDYSITRTDVIIPKFCPALGIPITPGTSRSNGSPSLDRVRPHLGYVPGNVRVISDRANTLKGLRGVAELKLLAKTSDPKLAEAYRLIAAYIDREVLLADVRERAKTIGTEGNEWKKIADFVEKIFHDRYYK